MVSSFLWFRQKKTSCRSTSLPSPLALFKVLHVRTDAQVDSNLHLLFVVPGASR